MISCIDSPSTTDLSVTGKNAPASMSPGRTTLVTFTLAQDFGTLTAKQRFWLRAAYGVFAIGFILLFLQSEAIRTNSREIELGRSMRVWLGSMGLSIGGTTYKLVTEQAKRISRCSLTFFAGLAE